MMFCGLNNSHDSKFSTLPVSVVKIFSITESINFNIVSITMWPFKSMVVVYSTVTNVHA